MIRAQSIALLLAGLALGCSAGGDDGSTTKHPGPASGGTGTGPGVGGSLNLGSGGSLSIDPGGMANGGTGAETCARDTQKAEQLPADLFILLDQSGSMTLEGNRWDPVTAAIKAFIQSPSSSGVGVGLQYFPLGATTTSDPAICNVQNYTTPAVPIGPLPDQAMALVSSIDAHYFTKAQGNDAAHWGTPTLPAVQGALQYLAAQASAHPERRPFLLLATDGLPSKLCTGNSIAGIAMALAAGYAGTPSIPTFIIGIGQIASLTQLATAGGTGKPPFIVDGAGTDTEAQLTAALTQIRQTALPCEYTIPPPSGGKLDPNLVNVDHTAAGAASERFFKVVDNSACRPGEKDWYYDNASAPTKVLMCPAACDALKSGGGSIDIVFGCASQEPPH